MNKLHLGPITSPLKGTIRLPGSKSLSNRFLMMQAYAGSTNKILNISNSDDTQKLAALLKRNPEIYDVGHAGTSARFLASYLAFKNGDQILTGSSRLQERPMQILVDALRSLGANIEYTDKEGFLPILLKSPSLEIQSELTIDGQISSQFISSLLMLAPSLQKGLTLNVENTLVSASYVNMTIQAMEDCNVLVKQKGNQYIITPQPYRCQDVTIEADWSAASYFFGWVAVMPGSSLRLEGLFEKSTQGDAKIMKIFSRLGVEAEFKGESLIVEQKNNPAPMLEYDFLLCPDIFQTVAVVASILGVRGVFTGLSTLKHKETDRIKAMQTELLKVQSFLSKLPDKFSKKKRYYMLENQSVLPENIAFETYQDHRMAMACSLFGSKGQVIINDPAVVSKSYPEYWDHLTSLGLLIEK